jgi:hypothetical protein
MAGIGLGKSRLLVAALAWLDRRTEQRNGASKKNRVAETQANGGCSGIICPAKKLTIASHRSKPASKWQKNRLVNT